LEPGFDEKRYGFGQFAELLNYAQDLSLVRLEPDESAVLRVYPGTQFTPTRSMAPAPRPAAIRPAEARLSAEEWAAASDTEGAAGEMPAAAEEHAVAGDAAPVKKKRTYRRRSRPRARPARAPRKSPPEGA
jgi:hypothetical protein